MSTEITDLIESQLSALEQRRQALEDALAELRARPATKAKPADKPQAAAPPRVVKRKPPAVVEEPVPAEPKAAKTAARPDETEQSSAPEASETADLDSARDESEAAAPPGTGKTADQRPDRTELPATEPRPVVGEPVAYQQRSEAEMRKMFLGSDGRQEIIDIVYSLGQASAVTLSYYLTATTGVIRPKLEGLVENGILSTDGPLWFPARPGKEITD